MEGFWRLMKQEMYYGKKYKTKGELILEKGVKKVVTNTKSDTLFQER